MPFPQLSFETFASLPGQDVLVLTVNNRQSRRLIADLAADLSESRRVRQAPRILPLSAWIRQAEDTLTFLAPDSPAHVLDSFGARQLWQQVIAQEEAQRPLLDIGQAATLAMDADRLMHEWQLQVPDALATTEYTRFQLWRKAYHDRLVALNAQDANHMFERVSAAVRNGTLDLSCRMLLLSGFAELSPRLHSLAQDIASRGIQVCLLDNAKTPAQRALRVQAPDPDAEWRMAAQWALERLRHHPDGCYAIVATQLESSVPFAHRVLRQAWKTLWPEETPRYNIAVARPLLAWPKVQAAIAWLRLQSQMLRHGRCEAPVLGQALLAGSCAGSLAEASARAALDVWLRSKGVLHLALPDWQQRLAQSAPQLAQAWAQSHAHVQSAAAVATLDTWMDHFRHELTLLGFPGEAALDSHEYQTLQSFDEALDSLMAQAFVFGKVSRDVALSALERMLTQTLFQPQRDPQARLDVLGMLEAEGGRWDGVWVLGLTDDVLPAVARPNPLLPLHVLRQANAPRATPARELQWARTMFEALLRCAPDMRFSHARMQGEQILRPSPFLLSLPEQEVAEHTLMPSAETVDAASASIAPGMPSWLEVLQDEKGPPLLAENAASKGGIHVLDTQARNPLWAFVKFRLGASRLPAYAQVADPNVRGTFLHHAIELVWRMLPGQDALQAALARNGLDDLLLQAVAQAADKHLADYTATLRQLECERAVDVLRTWLSFESQRVPFAIQALEDRAVWQHGGLTLNVRLDRIDRLQDGSLMIVDYKTGFGPIDPQTHWTRQRIVNLQLPFYAAVLAGQDVRALALVRLHARKTEVRGVADVDTGLEGLSLISQWEAFAQRTWSDVMQQWRDCIETLAQEYTAGYAANRIWHPADLDYCDVLPFLRLKEAKYHDA